ncbi:MAG TPA: nitroreductase family protein [Candidatus Dormibacteraeota bacterium]|jgi:nitroreductase|nr:nitroreductase family protein [Candidatus Dormibacteraeota bacterium]
MQFQEVVRRRRMIRNYEDRPVSEEARERILANALRAPSAGFSQGWAFLVLEAPTVRGRFWAAVSGPEEDDSMWAAGLRRAPLIIVALSHKEAYLDRYAEPDKGWEDRDEGRWPVPYWDIDTGFASLLMLLTAVDEQLGACFIGIQPERIHPFRATFGVPEPYAPIGFVTVGHPAPDVRSPSLRRGRRPWEEVVHRGRW